MNQNDERNLPDLPEKIPAKPAETGGDLPSEAPMEDAGTQALSDALASSFRFIRALMIILVVVFLGSGIFTVNPNEMAVLLRLGKPVGSGSDAILRPGLHWSFPSPIDEIVRIPVGESRTVEATNCWYQVTPEMEISGQLPPSLSTLQPGVDGYALTSDGNIIHARATAKYRIADPLRYAFGFHGATNILENALNNAVLYAAARHTAEEALYKDKTGFRDAVRLRFLQTIEKSNMGIQLEPIQVQTFPPMYVKEAFDQVLEAEQALSEARNTAQGESEEITRKAIGEGRALISDGITRSNMLVQTLRAESEAFSDQLADYQRNPRLFRERLLVETMSQVLTNVSDKWLLSESKEGGRQIRLMLNREPLNYTGDNEEDGGDE